MRKTASMRTNLVRVMEGPEVTVEVLHKDGDHVANKQLSNVQLSMNKCSIGRGGLKPLCGDFPYPTSSLTPSV